MPKILSGKELVKFLAKKGFQIYSRKGSHIKLISKERMAKTIIPMHDEIPKGTLNAILRQSKLTEKEIEELLK